MFAAHILQLKSLPKPIDTSIVFFFRLQKQQAAFTHPLVQEFLWNRDCALDDFQVKWGKIFFGWRPQRFGCSVSQCDCSDLEARTSWFSLDGFCFCRCSERSCCAFWPHSVRLVLESSFKEAKLNRQIDAVALIEVYYWNIKTTALVRTSRLRFLWKCRRRKMIENKVTKKKKEKKRYKFLRRFGSIFMYIRIQSQQRHVWQVALTFLCSNPGAHTAGRISVKQSECTSAASFIHRRVAFMIRDLRDEFFPASLHVRRGRPRSSCRQRGCE